MSPQDYSLRLVAARFAPPLSIEMAFGDGLRGEWPLAAIDLDPLGMNLATLHAVADGSALELLTDDAEPLRIETPVLRCSVDAKYAELLSRQVRALQMPAAKLAELAAKNPPPQQWHDAVEEKPF